MAFSGLPSDKPVCLLRWNPEKHIKNMHSFTRHNATALQTVAVVVVMVVVETGVEGNKSSRSSSMCNSNKKQ